MLVEELAIVHHTADWGISLGSHLHQVEVTGLSDAQGLSQGENPQLPPGFVNQPHFPASDLLVYSLASIPNLSPLTAFPLET